MYKDHAKKIVAIIEARMTSTRLPGKVLLPLAGKPAIERIIERLKRSRYLDDIVVATTVNKADDKLVKIVEELGIKCHRGSEDDVLSRVLSSAHESGADIIVEITADCPLVDPLLVDEGIEKLFEGDFDFTANNTSSTPTFPDGFDVRVFPTDVLDRVDKLTDDPIDRVHVTYYIWMHPEMFKVLEWNADKEHFGPDLRVTLDEMDDYRLLNEIFLKLLPIKENFGASDVVSLLRSNPALVEINKKIKSKKAHEG